MKRISAALCGLLNKLVNSAFLPLVFIICLFPILSIAGTGPVSGAVFSGVSGYVGNQITYAGIAGGVGPPTAGQMAAGTIGGGIAGGAAAGATASGMSGGDAGEGAGFGALGGAAFSGINSYWGRNWDIWRVGATTLAGGGLSAASGGDFQTGALFAFGASTAAYAYNTMLEYNPNPGAGENLPKGWYDANANGGRPPEGANVFGLNKPLTGDFWADFGKQSGALSSVANYIPGLNAVAGLHDY